MSLLHAYRIALLRCCPKERLFIPTTLFQRTAEDAKVIIRPMTMTSSKHALSQTGQNLNSSIRAVQPESTLEKRNEQRSFNNQLAKCQTAPELLKLLQDRKDALTQEAGGGAIDAVNLSTSLHRLARFSARSANDRDRILADPRFALLLASVGEAFAETRNNCQHDALLSFSGRNLSNMAWAIAKLKIAPSKTMLPSLPKVSNLIEVEPTIATTCHDIRSKVSEYETLHHHQSNKHHSHSQQPWNPIVSKLAGYILDEIAVRVVNSSSSKLIREQEYANLLWSWAKASRVDTHAFHVVIDRMISKQTQRLELRDEADDASASKPWSPSISQRSTQHILYPQTWSNALWAAAAVQVYSPRLVNYVAHLFQTQPSFIDDFKPQELSNTAWAVAKMVSNANEITQGAGTSALDTVRSILRVVPVPQDAGTSALGIVRTILRVVPIRAAEFNEQNLANTLWATATLSFGVYNRPLVDSYMMNDAVIPSNHPEVDNHIMQQSVTAILGAALPKMNSFLSQKLINIVWALSRLIQPDQVYQSAVTQKALHSIGEQLCDKSRSLTLHDIGIFSRSLATVGFKSEDTYRRIVSRMTQEHVKQAMSHNLSNTLWALATADVKVDDKDGFDTTLLPDNIRQSIRDPVTALYGSVAQELMRRPDDFTSKSISYILWSFSKLGIRHPSLFRSVACHLVGDEDQFSNVNDRKHQSPRGFANFSPNGLTNVAWAFAKQAELGVELQSRYPSNSTSLVPCNGKFAVHLTICLDYGENLVLRLFQGIADAGLADHDRLSRFTSQDLAKSAWAFTILGICHSQFMNAIVVESHRRLQLFVQGETVNTRTIFNGQAIANLLWAVASMNVPAHDLVHLIDSFAVTMCKDESGKVTRTSVARVFNRQALANLAWSCAAIGEYPPILMAIIYMGLFGKEKNKELNQLRRAHNDSGLGLPLQVIRPLMYVQTAMDLEGKNRSGLLLPANFPESWQLPQDVDPDGSSPMELNLTTSTIQREVSEAFVRIGFDHVQELVITMEDLVKQHGVKCGLSTMGILSMDIANTDRRITIEVNGPDHFVREIDEAVRKPGTNTTLERGNREHLFQWTNGENRRINGKTHLKDRLLTLLGWKVIHINFWEWEALKGDLEAQNSFCRLVLDAYG